VAAPGRFSKSASGAIIVPDVAGQNHRLDMVIAAPGLPFDGATLEHQALGGSETAVICLSRELAARGHRVRVFCNKPKAGVYGGVEYQDLAQLGPGLRSEPMDVFVAHRNVALLDEAPNSKLNFLWAHDLCTPGAARAINRRAWNLDGVLVMSAFQQTHYVEATGLPAEMFVITRNGLDLDLFPDPAGKRERRHLFYAARPERGLTHLVRPGGIMERLGRIDPRYKLFICGYANPRPETEEFYKNIETRVNALDNVVDLGQLAKRELYGWLSRVGLYVYPTGILDEFREISCIAAMEAQAAGLPILTTDRGALPETVGQAGVLIKPTPGVEDAFVAAILELTNSPEIWEGYSRAGRERSRAMDWSLIAAEWEFFVLDTFRGRTRDKVRLARHFLETSDVMAARRLAESHGPPEIEPEIERQAGAVLGEGNSAQAYEAVHVAPSVNQWTLGRDFARTTRGRATLEWFAARPELHGTKILDYACGHGGSALSLSNAFAGLSITAVDHSSIMIANARRLVEAEAEHPENISLDIAGPDWLDMAEPESFDVVMAQEFLEHVAEPWVVADKLERLVKPGGHCLFVTPIDYWDSEYRRSGDPTLTPSFHLWNLERADLYEKFGHKPGFEIQAIAAHHPLAHWPTKTRGHFLFSWRSGGEPAREIDWDRKYTLQNPRETVSVCMIVKNGADTLGRAIKSTKNFADEIIVADGGSTDDSMEIARAHGAQVIQVPAIEAGRFGFDDARNAAMESAAGDWILWLDADEAVGGAEHVNKYLRPNVFGAYAVRQHHFAVEPAGSVRIDRPMRLFRNHQGIRFYGKIHEHPETGLNQSIVPALEVEDVNIAHDGYLTEADRIGRFRRNFDLVRWDRRVYPERRLGRFFEIRDDWNQMRFAVQDAGGVTEAARLFARRVVDKYRRWLLGKGDSHLHLDGLGFYSDALAILDQGFEVGLSLQMGGPRGRAEVVTCHAAPRLAGSDPGPEVIRFADAADLEVFLNAHVRAALNKIGVRP
jgi:glycosyltransferase involved in cell wall biosynthesis/2-polyprenyl-3-methyl-5-hydroxy-6-metoxy-1,4-benzoquinol methylase